MSTQPTEEENTGSGAEALFAVPLAAALIGLIIYLPVWLVVDVSSGNIGPTGKSGAGTAAVLAFCVGAVIALLFVLSPLSIVHKARKEEERRKQHLRNAEKEHAEKLKAIYAQAEAERASLNSDEYKAKLERAELEEKKCNRLLHFELKDGLRGVWEARYKLTQKAAVFVFNRSRRRFALRVAAECGPMSEDDVDKLYIEAFPYLPVCKDWRLGALRPYAEHLSLCRALLPYLPPDPVWLRKGEDPTRYWRGDEPRFDLLANFLGDYPKWYETGRGGPRPPITDPEELREMAAAYATRQHFPALERDT